MAATEPISISFDNTRADHIAAARAYYRTTVMSKVDKLVSVALLVCGLALWWLLGWTWFVPFFFAAAVGEWFNLPIAFV